MRASFWLGILGGIFGILGATVAILLGSIGSAFSSATMSSLYYNAVGAIVFSILGMFGGIPLKKTRINAVIMIIAAIGVFVSEFILGILPAVFFVIGAVLLLTGADNDISSHGTEMPAKFTAIKEHQTGEKERDSLDARGEVPEVSGLDSLSSSKSSSKKSTRAFVIPKYSSYHSKTSTKTPVVPKYSSYDSKTSQKTPVVPDSSLQAFLSKRSDYVIIFFEGVILVALVTVMIYAFYSGFL